MIFLLLLCYYRTIGRNSHRESLSPLEWISANESPSHIITSSHFYLVLILGWNLVALTPRPFDSHKLSCENQALRFYGFKLPIPEESLFTAKGGERSSIICKGPKVEVPAKMRTHILSNCSLPLQSRLLPSTGDSGEMRRNPPQKRLQCQTLQLPSQRHSGVCQALYLFLAHAHAF